MGLRNMAANWIYLTDRSNQWNQNTRDKVSGKKRDRSLIFSV